MRQLWYALFLAVGGCAVAIAYLYPLPPPARIPIALTFLLVCPGLALIRLAHPFGDAESPVVLAVALSVAIGLIGTTAMTTVGWPSGWFLAALVGLTSIASIADVVRVRAQPAQSSIR